MSGGHRITTDLIKRVTGEYDVETVQWLNLNALGIKHIEGMNSCVSLLQLSLKSNQIREISGLDTLVMLQRLDLSANRIQRIANLTNLVALEHLDLRDNQITNIDDVSTLSTLPALRNFFLKDYDGTANNPACSHPSYHIVVTRYLPRLEILDGESLNLRECMANVVLENVEPDPESLKTPPRHRWCESFDWTPAPVESILDEILEDTMERFQHTMQACADLNIEAEIALARRFQVPT